MKITPHPLVPVPTPEDLLLVKEKQGEEGVFKLLQAREERIELAEENPLEYGFRWPSWSHALDLTQKYMEVFAYGGNGSSKTSFLGFITGLAVKHNPGANIWLFSQDETSSVQVQQKAVYHYIKHWFGNSHKTPGGGYYKYTPSNGFTDKKFFIDFEDGTAFRQVHFGTYSQFEGNRSKFEGYEYGSREPGLIKLPEQRYMIRGKEWVIPAWEGRLNLGAGFDEYLRDGDMYNTITYRVPRRGAFVYNGFTPINQMTPFVASKIKGSQITKTISTNPKAFGKESDPKEVEWVREKKYDTGPKAGVGMVYFPSEHNHWAGFDNMVTLHGHKPLPERLVRFHGIPSDVITSLFPKFSTNVNVVKERWKFDPKNHTCYMVADPAGKRSYSCIWALVNKYGEIHILSEFPERGIYGDWAKFGSPRWTYAEGSKKVYMSVASYVEEWRKIEEDLGVTPMVRIGDSRAFATENDDSVDRFAAFSEHDMHFEPSDGRQEEIGLQMLDEWFDYDVSQPVDSVNRPLLTIHESCGNLIDSILNYNAVGKQDEALKDFIDLIRYLRMANAGEGPEHYDEKAFQTQSTTGGY